MDTFEWTEETPVTANNLNEMQRTLNSNMEWTLVGTAVGGNTINVPSGAVELLAIVKVANNDNLQFMFNIPTAYLTTSNQAFNNGYYRSTSINAYVRIHASSAQVKIFEANYNNTEVPGSSVLTLYYR